MPERLIAPDALQGVSALLARHGFGKKIVLTCDDRTWLAAGQQLHLHLNHAGYLVTPHSFGRDVYATMEKSVELIEEARGAELLVAVGAGTVNDLTKYAAAQLDLPYICVATGASMNGYTSPTASLQVDNFKHSYPARAPKAVVADINVLVAAPKRLARAGLGDTLCRSTVEADMLLSHHLRGTPYPKDIFDVLRAHEPELIAHANMIGEHHHAKIALLMQALLDGGDAMATYGSSAVASQGEHMIAHTAEMIYGSEMRGATHGEVIAVTTLTMTHLQQRMLRFQPSVKPLPREASRFERVFGKAHVARFTEAYAKKLFSAEEAEAMNQKLVGKWDAIKQEIAAIMIPPISLERAYKLTGLPTTPKSLAIDPVRYENAVHYAYLTRDRFTFLDLAAMNDRRAS